MPERASTLPPEVPPPSEVVSLPSADDPIVGALADRIALLRDQRARRQRDPSLTDTLQRTQRRAASVQRRLGQIINLWTELLPPELADHTSVRALRGGNLQVAVESAALVYELDRRLREGLLAELRARFTGNLHRVRFTVAASGNHRSH